MEASWSSPSSAPSPTRSWSEWATSGIASAARSGYNFVRDVSYITSGSVKSSVVSSFTSGKSADSALGFAGSFADTATNIVTLGHGTDYSSGSGLYGNREAYQGGRSVGYATQSIQASVLTGAATNALVSRAIAYAPRAVTTAISTFGRGAEWLDRTQGAIQIASGDASGIEAFLPGVGGRTLAGTQLPSTNFSSHRWGDPDTIPCFPAEALVHTPDGLREISTLREGDLVLAYDSASRSVVPRQVTACLVNWTVVLVRLTVDGETIWATKTHPFYSPEGGWMPACDLRPGMRLLDKDLQPRVIENAEHRGTHETTYNITVDELHTFFVGEIGVLVHNSSFESTTRAATQIYLIRDQEQNPAYVGKTTQGIETRFQQHINTNHPEWANGYSFRQLANGDWTPYEAAVWEKHYMDVYGGKNALENRQVAITEAKYNRFKSSFNPC
ncbi:GIY-YIG nuclease family protein [bacterium]|nr:GIY-YIG nuclease family protein [bacterium]